MSSHSASARRAARLGFALLLAVPAAWAQADADALSEGLIRLRGEVEQLNSELELLREEQRVSLAALNAQRAELAASVERQQLVSREIRQKLEAQIAEAQAAGVTGDTLKPLLLEATGALERQISAGLPFKIDERLGELTSFRNQIENGTLSPQRAVNRLWAFYEDEFRLTRENGLHSQTIALGNERVLADVAKLGAMAMYFQTQDGRIGQAQRASDGWTFVLIEDAEAQKQVAVLFDSLRKQIRQGYFELPLGGSGSAS
jgi:hypothetical protein